MRYSVLAGPIAILFAATAFASTVSATPASPSAAAAAHAPILIQGNAGFTSANGVVGGTGTAADPYRIEGWIINTTAGAPGITITATSAHVLVRSDTIQFPGGLCGGIALNRVANVTIDSITTNQCDPGIQIQTSTDVAVTNSTLWAYQSPNVYVYNSTRVAIDGNSISGGSAGVSADLVQDVTVSGNRISNGFNGIGVQEVSDVRSRVTNNTIGWGNTGLSFQYSDDGLAAGNVVDGTWGGIGFDTVTNVTLRGNTVLLSGDYAVSSGGSANLTIVSNLFQGNGGGMDWFGTNTGIVSHNRFLNNIVQSWDELTAPWDDGYPGGGNWWSDYHGVDHCSGAAQDVCTGGDGIGDTPYMADTPNGVVVRDRYPLMIPGLPIQVSATAPGQVGIGQAVRFSATAEDPEGVVTSYSWAFGDGATGVGPNVTHAYTSSGSVVATVTVVDNRSVTGQARVTVTVLPPVAMVLVRHSSGFQILVPADWETHTDYALSGNTVPVASLGPAEAGFRTNVLVNYADDPHAQETASYLDEAAYGAFDAIQRSHPDAYFAEAPVDLTLAGHAAVAFTIGYTSQSFLQRGVYVVSAVHARDWFILLTVAASAYPVENATFGQMLAGFAITALPPLVAVAIGVGVVLGLVAAVVLLVVRRRRRLHLSEVGPEEAIDAPPSALRALFCVNCGVPMPPGSSFCGSCGAPAWVGPPSSPGPPGPPQS